MIDYIDVNYAVPLTLRDVAESVGYSACHLAHLFSSDTGSSINAWIIRRRIEAAKQLLRAGDVDVTTACETVGFNDLSYFIRQFARHVGTTPGKFRALTTPHAPGGPPRSPRIR